MVSIALTQRINLEKCALRGQQFPVREEVFAMNAYPRPNLGFVIAVHLSSKSLTSRDVKRSLTPRMPCVQMGLLVTFSLFGTHSDEYTVKQR